MCDNGVPCDDGNPLTVDDKCFNMRCRGTVMDDDLPASRWGPSGSRHFAVTLRVELERQALSPVVWAVHDPHYGYMLKSGDNATAGLRALAEYGEYELLLEELEEMKQKGEVKSYGVTKESFEATTMTTWGQEFNFLVVGGAHDHLSFATRLLQSDDRLVAPFEGGIPLFNGFKPNYGEQENFTLWDTATKVNQPFFAQLNVGAQSTQGVVGGQQEYGTIYVVRPTEYVPSGLFNSHWPKPVDFIKMIIGPGVGVRLSDRTRAQTGVQVSMGLTIDSGKSAGNEFRIAFPEGFEFHKDEQTIGNFTWWGLQRHFGDRWVLPNGQARGKPWTKDGDNIECGGTGSNDLGFLATEEECARRCESNAQYFKFGMRLTANCNEQGCMCHCESPGLTTCNIVTSPGWSLYHYFVPEHDTAENTKWGQPSTYVDVRTRTVFLRWPDNVDMAPTTAQTMTLTLHNIRNPNNCKPTQWSLTTHKCQMKDLNGAGVWEHRVCSKPIYTYSAKQLDTHADGCNRCNACVWEYDSPSTGMAIFSCYDNGITFQRERPLGTKTFSEFFTHGGSGFDGACVP